MNYLAWFKGKEVDMKFRKEYFSVRRNIPEREKNELVVP